MNTEAMSTLESYEDASAQGKRRVVVAGALAALALFAVLHQETMVFLGQMWWNHQAYGHGLLLIPVGCEQPHKFGRRFIDGYRS